MSINPEVTTGRTTPIEQRDYCVLCNTAPCEHPLPDWAAEAGASNWAEFLLKFIVSHPAVTCAIPATSRVDHMRENMGAATGTLPEPALRARMAGYVAGL